MAKIIVPGKQIVGVTDWETPGEQFPWGPQKPLSTRERVTWPNDTSVDPLGVSPFDQNKNYVVEVKSSAPVLVKVTGEPAFGVTRTIVKGSDLCFPANGDHGPSERQEAVLISEVALMPAIYEAVEIEVPIPPV